MDMLSMSRMRCAGVGLLGTLLSGVLVGCGGDSNQTNPAPSPQPSPHTMPIASVLIGGGQANCSSFSSDKDKDGIADTCTATWSDIIQHDSAFAGLQMQDIQDPDFYPLDVVFSYQMDMQKYTAILADPDLNQEQTALLKQILDYLLIKLVAPQSWAETETIINQIPTVDQKPILNALSTTTYTLLREGLVVTPVPSKRLYELRSVQFAKDADNRAIYQTIVDAARALSLKPQPKVLVITASAENPMADRDINIFAFKSTGADAVWLPVSGGFQMAYNSKRCDALNRYYSEYANAGFVGEVYHQHLIFNDLAQQQQKWCENIDTLYAQIDSADAVYFSGGDQVRHLESLVTRDQMGLLTQQSPILNRLATRFAAGQLVVAGTSAGAAVQSGHTWQTQRIPMIGGGASYDALLEGFKQGAGPTPSDDGKQALMYQEGGFGFFPYGVVDTHFSERAREARLIRLVDQQQVRYGFGIDENTALVTRQASAHLVSMGVVGSGGVWIVDMAQSQRAATDNGLYSKTDIVTHYITAGDRLLLNTQNGELQILFADDKLIAPEVSSAIAVTANTLYSVPDKQRVYLATMNKMAQSGATQAQISNRVAVERGQQSQEFVFDFSRVNQTRMAGRANQYAYSNVLLSITAKQAD